MTVTLSSDKKVLTVKQGTVFDSGYNETFTEDVQLHFLDTGEIKILGNGEDEDYTDRVIDDGYEPASIKRVSDFFGTTQPFTFAWNDSLAFFSDSELPEGYQYVLAHGIKINTDTKTFLLTADSDVIQEESAKKYISNITLGGNNYSIKDSEARDQLTKTQPKLIAGNNIEIDEETNTISATGGGSGASVTFIDWRVE